MIPYNKIRKFLTLQYRDERIIFGTLLSSLRYYLLSFFFNSNKKSGTFPLKFWSNKVDIKVSLIN